MINLALCLFLTLFVSNQASAKVHIIQSENQSILFEKINSFYTFANRSLSTEDFSLLLLRNLQNLNFKKHSFDKKYGFNNQYSETLRVAVYENPFRSQENKLYKIVDSLLNEISSENKTTIYSYLNSRNKNLTFDLLELVASIPSCDSSNTASSQCITKSGSLWENHGNNFKNIKTGYWVSSVLGYSHQDKAYKLCPEGMSLPSGYPDSWRGYFFIPTLESDLAILEKNGIREVVPKLKDSTIWTAPLDGITYGDNGFVFSGQTGKIHHSDHRDVNFNVLCISR